MNNALPLLYLCTFLMYKNQWALIHGHNIFAINAIINHNKEATVLIYKLGAARANVKTIITIQNLVDSIHCQFPFNFLLAPYAIMYGEIVAKTK